MLAIAFIDIRMPDKPSMPFILSDVFHNIPGGMAHGVSSDKLFQTMRATAKRHGVERYIEKIEAHCRDKISKAKIALT